MNKERQVHSTEEALKLALEALRMPCDRWNKTQTIKVQEAIKTGEEALMSFQDGAQPAVAEQHKQEPVAWYDTEEYGSIRWANEWSLDEGAPLYTTPPQRKPLTDEQKAYFVNEIVQLGTGFVTPLFAIVEAIEKAAHGSKDKTCQ